ncbi:MAG: pyruvate dehydrogenase (acetyl-transferring) E1 component subunit alpha [Simkaniaceae bacterium]|nr:pyruvate dehydrogenase (acetyl-transferring) E1 component subunit alpha [Simkaniaceae bacterium]
MNKEEMHEVKYTFLDYDRDRIVGELGKEVLLDLLRRMVAIRQFEVRAESAYQQGKIGGFFHAYMGQEAIQTGAVAAIGVGPNWWATTYRCHALAYLTGATLNDMMAELYGKRTGNARGRGGSMHLYSDRLLGGFGIVGGHVPVATGAAFSLKYRKQKGVAVCFFGDGAVAQGAVHESLNLAALWDLPAIYVIENNRWGMGTAVGRAICVQPIAENMAKGYGIPSYTFDGMDVLACYAGFHKVREEVLRTGRPVLIEAVTERFRGHSISDPASYRSKEELSEVKAQDPILHLQELLKEVKVAGDEEFREINRCVKQEVLASMEFAEQSPFAEPDVLEEGVFAP